MLEKFENFLMAVLTVMGLTLVVVEVFLRYFFPRYLTDWGMEFTIYFSVWSIIGRLRNSGLTRAIDIAIMALTAR